MIFVQYFFLSISFISVKLPHYVAGVMLEENPIYMKLYAKLGLSVTWNRDDAVMVISPFNMYPFYKDLYSQSKTYFTLGLENVLWAVHGY